MKIGVDARLIYHQPAGISRYTVHLLQALARLEHDHNFLVLQHRKQKDPIFSCGKFQHAILRAPVHTFLEQMMLPLELLPHSLDLLHCTDFIPPLYSPIPTVITVHDLAFLHWPHFLTKDSAAYYGQIDRAVTNAKHIIVPSENTKQDLMGQLGVADQKVSVIYEAADSIFAPLPMEMTRQKIDKKFQLPSTYVFAVGTVEPRKNIGGLLHAFRYLLDKYNMPNVGLAIAGSHGWLYEDVLDKIQALKLERHVFFLGRISDQELQQLYVGARCHIHPAHYEGFGLPPLEAMACGTPTIVSNVSSLPEVVGDAALLVDPNDPEEMAVALHRLLTEDGLHSELRAKGLQRAQCFTWERAARQTLEIYQEVGSW